MPRRPVLLALAAALGLGACSGGDDGTSSLVPECLGFADLYALTGPESEGMTNWSDARGLAAELGSATVLPDEPLEITGPGEESGTYGSYVELALKGIAEERAAAGKISEDQVETTRKDYTSSGNDNVILEGVAGSRGSLGWVGFAYADQAEGLRLLAIDGGDGCVEPTPATIADGTYPLARTLYVYVNAARAEANPAVAAYVDTYLSDEGRSSVSEVDYVPLTDADWEATQAAWAATGLGGAGAEDLSGSVTVSGSSTVEPISGLVAERFADDNPDVAISVEGPGTSDGMELFCADEIDIADASRPMKDEERQACADAGIEFVELAIGIDGLSVITKG